MCWTHCHATIKTEPTNNLRSPCMHYMKLLFIDHMQSSWSACIFPRQSNVCHSSAVCSDQPNTCPLQLQSRYKWNTNWTVVNFKTHKLNTNTRNAIFHAYYKWCSWSGVQCVRVYVCMCVCVCLCVQLFVCACVCVCWWVIIVNQWTSERLVILLYWNWRCHGYREGENGT